MTKMESARRVEILFEGDKEKHRKEVEVPFYPPDIRYPGLCLTCNHALTCTFPRSPGSPVLYCEELDISTTPQPRMMSPVVAQAPTHGQCPAEGPLGLCGNCENRSTCVFPKAEGGVWQCEEYT